MVSKDGVVRVFVSGQRPVMIRRTIVSIIMVAPFEEEKRK